MTAPRRLSGEGWMMDDIRICDGEGFGPPKDLKSRITLELISQTGSDVQVLLSDVLKDTEPPCLHVSGPPMSVKIWAKTTTATAGALTFILVADTNSTRLVRIKEFVPCVSSV